MAGNGRHGASAALLAAGLSLSVSAGYIFARPDLSRGAAFLFSDEAANLFVADALARGGSLYSGVAYPYGPIPIHLYALVTALFGNTAVVYLWTMAALSAISVGAVAWLVRRCADPLTAALLVVIGLVPTMPLPGAGIGGYTSSIYMPLERLALLVGALLWIPPERRTAWRSVALGLVLGFCQGIRFGSGLMMVAAVVVIDQLACGRPAPPGMRGGALRSSLLVLCGFVMAECAWATWAFATLPAPHAVEFLWPLQMWETHRVAVGVPRWPTWGGSKMAATQYAMPIVLASLSIAAAWRWSRGPSKGPAWEANGPAMLLLVFFGLGALVFFRHEHHFRQFAWMLVPAAAAALAGLRPTARLVAVVLCVPSLWPIVSALAHRPAGGAVRVQVPRGFDLFVSPDTAERLRFLEPYTHAGAVLFVPNGAGWLYAYGVEHVTRHTWFYSPAAVRPFEAEQFARDVAAARVVLQCGGGAGDWPLPASAADAIARGFRPVDSRAGCRVLTRTE